MLSYLARRSLVLTSRSYHIARAMSVAVKIRPPQMLTYSTHRLARPVYTSCFRFTSDSKGTSGKEFWTNVEFTESLKRFLAVYVTL